MSESENVTGHRVRGAAVEAAWVEFTDALRMLPEDCQPEFNAPCTSEDLDLLAEAVAPWPVPVELRTLLELANGQVGQGPGWMWDILRGGFLPAQEIVRWYQWAKSKPEVPDCPAWAMVTRESLNSASIELVDHRPPMVINTTLPNPPSPLAPTLPLLLRAAAGLIHAGHVGQHDATWHAENPRASQREYSEALVWLHAFYQSEGWGLAPFRQSEEPPQIHGDRLDGSWISDQWISREDWPQEWHTPDLSIRSKPPNG